MSKQIDHLLDSLIKEIDAKDAAPAPKEPKPASAEALDRAEKIAKGVNQSYRRPPEPVKQSIPAPKRKPVIEPEPTSHFSNARPTDPAIRMHDRLDESTLPAPDAERRPTQIMDIGGKKKNKKRKTRSIPAPPEAPARKIPHIQVPDELPPDVANAPKPTEVPETDTEREELVRARAEKIREQLKKRTLEETPIIAPPTAKEINDMLVDLENPKDELAEAPAEQDDNNIFSYLHQVLGVEEEAEQPEAEETVQEEAPAAARPRWFDDAPAPATMPLHSAAADLSDNAYDDEYDDEEDLTEDTSSGQLHFLDAEDEPEEKRENPIAAFFKNLFGKRRKDEDEDIESDEMYEDAYEEDNFDGLEEDLTVQDELPATEVPLPEDEETYPAPPMPEPAPAKLPEEPVEEPAEEEAVEEPAEEAAAPEMDEDEDADDLYDDFDDEDLEDEEVNPEPFRFEEEKPAAAEKAVHHSFLREAFDESAEELADIKAEPVPQPETESGVKSHFLGRNSYFVAGILVFVLALIGLVTLVSGIFKAAGGFFQGGSLKSQLEQTLYPVAVVDVPAFNEPAELTADGALSAAILDILMHDDLSGYTETFDMIAVPAEDVLARGRQLFGVDVQSQLSTLHAAGESFVYDETTGCYNVPTAPMIFSYSPEVKNIRRNGDTYEVTVVYNSDVADWQEHSRNFTEGNSKTMQATIEKKSAGYRIVRLVPAE